MIENTGRFALLAVVAFAVLGANDLALARSLSMKSRSDADAAPAAQTEPIVMSARVGEHPGLTRFVLELSDPVTPRVFTLANPDRVVLDLPDVLWRLAAPDRPSGRGAIRSYRYGMFRPGDSRIVIDLNHPVSPAPVLLIPPKGGSGYRLVLDLLPTSNEQFARSAGWPEDVLAKADGGKRAIEAEAPRENDSSSQ